VFAKLRAAFPNDRYHAGSIVREYENRPDGVRVSFTDGTTQIADLLVGADGIRSTIRRSIRPDVEPQYAGYVAWRGTPTRQNSRPALATPSSIGLRFACRPRSRCSAIHRRRR